ncbi:uncharacterized protein LOC126857760 [Cataglyphis hispanica]|uniref:uncharacterized protein LOC126857760 n=1 Tax=Cataglyphis hispanica TaxID=1086592 RepID=UPI00217FB030|nr:uncharacterized protein LOC126857760 [Cataglyphis hispanica]
MMLVTGIMEMKHVDMYIDVTEFTDEEILEHPIFIHNFVMCILSMFVMTLYLIQAWVLFDHWQWIRGDTTSVSSSSQSYDSSVDSDVSEDSINGKNINKHNARQQVVELAPIPSLRDLSVSAPINDSTEALEDDEPILYCCCIDWCDYIKIKMKSRPKHEFQVIHVM